MLAARGSQRGPRTSCHIPQGAEALLTGQIRNQVDTVWTAFWSGGISNPLKVIEQFTYLQYMKGLDAERYTLILANPPFKGSLDYENCAKDLTQNPSPPPRSPARVRARVEAIERLKALHRRSLEEMDALFASRQHRAFRGEL